MSADSPEPDSSEAARSPYGAASSPYVTFFAPSMTHIDLRSPPGVDGADAALGEAGIEAAAKSLRELGDEAAWTLTSAKVGNGVEQLRDNDPLTFWQSVGEGGARESCTRREQCARWS